MRAGKKEERERMKTKDKKETRRKRERSEGDRGGGRKRVNLSSFTRLGSSEGEPEICSMEGRERKRKRE